MASRPIDEVVHPRAAQRRPALGLVLVFFAVLLSPIVFDAIAPVLAR